MAESDPRECLRWIFSATEAVPVMDGDQLALIGPLAALEAVAELRQWLMVQEFRLAAMARKSGASWATVAAALDEPKASVHRRHSDPWAPMAAQRAASQVETGRG